MAEVTDEWALKGKHRVVFKNNNNEKPKSHDRLYHITVVLDGEEYGKGADYSIKGAEQLAAEKTWQMLVEKELAS